MIRRPSSPGSSAHRAAGSVLLALSLLSPACLSTRDTVNEVPQGSGACAVKCHGDGTTAAPPVDLDGNTSTTARGVGAHRRHLEASDTHVAFACSTCHSVPASVEAPGHMDGSRPAKVTFAGAAVPQGASAAYDPVKLNCATTYCHGGPGDIPWPSREVWNNPKPPSEACGTSCHSLPPGGNHPQNDTCETCHPDTAGPNHTIKNPSLHINGKVEVNANKCNTCHGSDKNDAPPVDLSGSSDTTRLGVGAHQTHLAGGLISKPVPCEDCHVVPSSPNDPGHMDTPLPAELTFSGIAVKNSSPAWSHDDAKCTNVYCHGSTTLGGSNPTPIWNVVNGSQAVCGSCHGLPPPLPHSQITQCELCHDQTAGPNHTIINRDLHIDGTVEVKGGSCHACHGSDANNAPPVALDGSSSTSDVGVGAHQTHLKGGLSSRVVLCQECHVVPTSVDQPGHIDSTLPAELTFSGVATADSASPSWSHDTVTCSGVYCHGATLTGGTNTNPKWTTVDGSQSKCGSCHGLPPPAPHINSTRCELCHNETAGPGMTIKDPTKHIDGTVEVKSMDCNSCHGSADNDAPPVDVSGSSDTHQVTVGAHQTHLSGGVFSAKVDCVDCHIVPASVSAPGHIDSTPSAEVTFSSVAVADGATPSWDRTAATCSAVYCHGATLGGGTNTKPVWTTVDGTQATCGSCHSLPPPPPHVANPNCELCHTPTAGPNHTIADRTTHVDGKVTIPGGPCNQCHGDATLYAPPKDVAGNTSTTAPGVGAHRAHLVAQLNHFSKPIACDTCHPVPPLSTVHENGTRDVIFGGIASGTVSGAPVKHSSTPAFNDSPTYTCSQTYCHGDWTESGHPSGGSLTQPVWNKVDDSQAYCGSCHSIPPPAPHPASSDCQSCHPHTVDSMLNLNLDYHLNGQVDF